MTRLAEQRFQRAIGGLGAVGVGFAIVTGVMGSNPFSAPDGVAAAWWQEAGLAFYGAVACGGACVALGVLGLAHLMGSVSAPTLTGARPRGIDVRRPTD